MAKEELKPIDVSKYTVTESGNVIKDTKDKLKQEAEEWLCNNLHSASEEDFIKAMFDIAEPREKRIAELKKELNYAKTHCLFHSDCPTQKENAKLNNFIMQSKKDGISPINALIIKNLGNQLIKAREIIKKFSEFVNNEIEYDPEHPQEHTDLWNKLCEEAGQFLSEVEK